jgi:hypothetical protein
MQGELEAEGVNAQILGVNGLDATLGDSSGYEIGNPTVTSGRTTPWLQPTDAMSDPWITWAVEYRDVVLLDEQNFPVAVYNLTQNSLDTQANYDALKALLVQFATD